LNPNGPITVVAAGTSVASATGSDILVSSKNPFTKLDTSNIVSFQTISILFDHEPPQPPSSAPLYSTTQLYQFPHGYNYIPSPWLMWRNDSPELPAAPSAGNSATSFYPFGDDTAGAESFGAIQTGDYTFNQASPVAILYYNYSGAVFEATSAALYATADDQNIYINLMKNTGGLLGGSVIPLYLAGVTLNIRTYCFTEPANSSTY
jgi:hypothetical protein